MATMTKTVGPALKRADGNREQAPKRLGGRMAASLHLAHHLWRIFRRRQDRRRAELDLKALSDARLKDLGLHRTEISSFLLGLQRDEDRRLHGSDAPGWPTGRKSG